MSKKHVLTFIGALVLSTALLAQSTEEEFLTRYQLLTSKVGVDGLGVETLIGKWETAFPDNADMLVAKFIYYYTKAQSTEAQSLDQSKYMGQKPILTLADTLTGKNTNYFQVTKFDDEMFGIASSALDRAIRLRPNDIDMRVTKVNALINYETESPDMALQAVNALIDYDATSHPQWTSGGLPVEEGAFAAEVQQFCVSFYAIGSESSVEAFRDLSLKMSKYYPKDPQFIANVGSYYLAHQDDVKTALKYYNKVLKLDPNNYVALKNCVLAARRLKDVKLELKYLPRLVEQTPDETEKAALKVRLDALRGK